MEVLLLRKPHEVSFAGNPVAFTFIVTPYTETEHKENIGLSVTIEVEEGFNTNVFLEARQAVYLPNQQGIIEIDVQHILEAYLIQYVPSLALQNPTVCAGQSRRYRLRYQLLVNGAIEIPVDTTETFNVLKGGISYQEWHPKKFFTEHLQENPSFLRYSGAEEKVHADEFKYLSWVYPYNDRATQIVTANVFYTDGSQVNKEIGNGIVCDKWQVCITPAGFNQLGLGEISTKIPLYYQILVTKYFVGTVIAQPQKFTLDYRNFYNTYNLIYAGSLGGIETLRMRGQVDAQAEYQKTIVDRVTPSNYFTGGILQAPSKVSFVSENEKFNGDTGFVPKDKIDRLRDIFLSQDCLYEIKHNRLVPVVIDTKTVKLYTNIDKLFSMSIEWRHAFNNQFYAPGNLLPAVNTSCPVPVFFQARQLDKNNLQVLWALEPEYSEIEIEYPGQSGPELITLQGNTGQVKIAFKNHLIINPNAEVDITLKARTVCDSTSQPASVSAWAFYTFNIRRNSLPIAIEDILTASRGVTVPTLIEGNILTNDYDPDGDPIQCVPVNNEATTKGGRISITANGRVSYRPPTATFEGEDAFLYEIFEAGNPAAYGRAFVKIVVGNPTAGSVIYAKVVLRNVKTVPQLGGTATSAEVWIDFFADALGTLPINVGSLGLTVTYERKSTSIPAGIGDGIEIITGTLFPISDKVRILDNLAFLAFQSSSSAYKTEYKILPGTGYAAI